MHRKQVVVPGQLSSQLAVTIAHITFVMRKAIISLQQPNNGSVITCCCLGDSIRQGPDQGQSHCKIESETKAEQYSLTFIEPFTLLRITEIDSSEIRFEKLSCECPRAQPSL